MATPMNETALKVLTDRTEQLRAEIDAYTELAATHRKQLKEIEATLAVKEAEWQDLHSVVAKALKDKEKQQ